MKMTKSKKFTVAIAAVVGLAIIGAGIWFIMNAVMKEPATRSYIDYMDNISDLKLSDIDGQSYTLDQTDKKFMVFLASDCGTCIEALPALRKIKDIICCDQGIEMMLLWEDDIPKKDVETHDLSQSSYSLGNVRISSALDTVFFVDEKNDVQFADSSGGFENILSFVLSYNTYDKEKMLQNANRYITTEVAQSSEYPQLIYFSLPGCPDCEEANDIVFSDELKQQFHITRIERDKNAHQDDIIDDKDLFKMIYEIDWYPSFLIIQEDERWDMIRKIDISELKENVLSLSTNS